MTRLKSGATTALTMLMVLALIASVAVTPVAAQNSELNYDAGPNLVITEDSVTIAEHDRTEMASPLEYYDDDGDVATLTATINHSASENPLEVDYSKVDAEAFETFPRESDAASAMNASEWTKDAAGSAGTGTIAASTVGDVDAVEFSTSSQTSGDTMVFEYSNFSALDDADKRVLLSAFEVVSADSGATVELAAVESDGDEKSLELYNASGDSANLDDVATTTGSGFVGQAKLANLDVAGSGDADLQTIDSIEVRIHDGNADIKMTGLDAEIKSKLVLGDHYNTSSEETETFYQVESPGSHNVTSLTALGSWTSDATIHDLTVKNLRYSAEYASPDDVQVDFTEATNYQYPSKAEIYQSVEVPAAIDLSHNGLSLEATQNFVEPRYVAVEYAEGSGDVDDVENASYTDLSGTYTDIDTTHLIDDTVTVGTEYTGHWMILLNDDEVKDLQATDGGAVGGPVSSSSGFLGSIGSWIGGVVGSLLGILGLRRAIG